MIESIDTYITKISDIKKKIDLLRPFDSFQLKNLKEWFRVWFIQNSNAIEWNTLTLQEVKLVIEEWITVWWKTIRELKETINHWELMKILDDFFQKKDVTLDENFVLKIHKILLKDLLPIKHLWKWRTIQVYISWSEEDLPKPDQIDSLMWKYFKKHKQIKGLKDVAWIHYDFIKIHPLADGNGRIARILMNLALVKLWYMPIIIPQIVRWEYIHSLTWNDFDKRYTFFLWQVYENHKDYLKFLN